MSSIIFYGTSGNLMSDTAVASLSREVTFPFSVALWSTVCSGVYFTAVISTVLILYEPFLQSPKKLKPMKWFNSVN